MIIAFARRLNADAELLEAYVDHRRAMGVAWSTVKNELAILSAAQNTAVDGERLDQRFVTSFRKLIPKFDNARELVWSPEEFWAVHKHLPFHLQQIFEFGWLTGWRHRSEVLALNYASHVDLAGQVIRLTKSMTKERHSRKLPYVGLPPLAALIERQVEWTTAHGYDVGDHGQAFFHRPRGYRIVASQGRRVTTWRRAFAWAKRLAAKEVEGFKLDLRYHDLRHTVVTRLQEAGVRPKVITQLTGHRTVAMQQRYDNPTPDQIADALGKVDDALRRQTVRIA